MSPCKKFQYTVSGVHGALLQAALDSVTRPAAGVQGHSQGLLFERLSMEETNALAPVPNRKAATRSHVQVRRLEQMSQIHPADTGWVYIFQLAQTV